MNDASSNAQVPAPVPALGFSISVELTPGRAIVVQSHIANDVKSEEIDSLLDKAMRALERQKTRALEREELSQYRELERQQTRQHEGFSEDFNRLETKLEGKQSNIPAGRRTAPSLSPAEQSQRDNARLTLEKGKKALDDTRAKIKDLEAKVAAHDAPSGG